MTDPLTPADLDLRDFDWMPLQVVRLRDSDIVVMASPEAFRAAVLLWCSAWHQVPAASLPKDERLLANLAGFGRDLKAWRAVSVDALRGFVECTDGRLYHPVIADKAIEADGKRRVQRKRTQAATSARRGKQRNDDRDEQRDVERDDGRNDHQETGSDRTGQDQTKPEKSGESYPRSNLKLVEEGSAVPIDESYEPSDRAIEYAYSLGMKKADLNAELSKFIAMSMATRAVSFNPDMSFKVWCDRWLDFKRKGNPDWKPAPEPIAVPQEPFVLVIQGTPEAAAWDHNNRSKHLRPLFFSRHIVDGVEVIAARCRTLLPEGYDEATGEFHGEANVA